MAGFDLKVGLEDHDEQLRGGYEAQCGVVSLVGKAEEAVRFPNDGGAELTLREPAVGSSS